MTITTTQYGAYEHGTPYRTQCGTCQRVDTYRSDSPDLDGNRDRAFAANIKDDSPIYSGPYNPSCSCCWLGFTHTTAAHNAKAGAA